MIRRAALLVVASTVVLTACAPKSSDFSDDAAELVAEGLAVDPGGEWDVTCDRPAATEVDETFTCRAVGQDNEVLTFTATITGRAKYVVSQDTTTTTVPAAPAG